MPLTAITAEHINAMVMSDANYLRSVIEWVNRRYDIYNAMLTADLMTAQAIDSEIQSFILAFIGDLNRLKILASGTVPADADNMLWNITHLLGLE